MWLPREGESLARYGYRGQLLRSPRPFLSYLYLGFQRQSSARFHLQEIVNSRIRSQLGGASYGPVGTILAHDLIYLMKGAEAV